MKKYILKYVFVFLVAFMGMQQADAKVWYVNSPTVVWQGKSTNDVKDKIQDAITAAASGDEIWVAAGTHKLDVTITLKEGVDLYGGFAGTETGVDKRQLKNGGRGWEFVNVTVLDVQSKARVLTGKAFSKEVIVDGFTIMNGKGSGAAKAGGGMYSEKNTIVRNCIFTGNYASDAGGGLNLRGDNSLVEECYFFLNKATHGGAAAIGSGATMNHCLVENNQTNTTNSNYWATGWGGGVMCDNGAVTNCEIYNNKASFGGGIYLRNAKSAFYNCIIAYNTGHQGGGVAWDYRSKGGKCVNCIVASNTATLVGGGFLFNGNSGNSPVLQTVANCIVWNNISKDVLNHYTLYNSNGKVEWEFTPTLYNNAFQGDISGLKGENHLSLTLDSAAYFRANWEPVDHFPGIDKGASVEGTPTVDIAGNVRISGRGIDIGAYEYAIVPKPDGDVFYVDPNANGSMNGSSWTNAFVDLGAAISAAKLYNVEHNKQTKVWMAAGTYKINSPVILMEGVSIYGGFNKTEKSEDEREIGYSEKLWDLANPTILDAENSTNILIQTDHYGKYDAVVDGFTFKNGNSSSDGGAVSMKDYGIVQNCQFINCVATNGGGGLFYAANSAYNTRVRVRNCYFTDCSAKEGGALKLNAYMSNGDVTSCLVENCSASSCGGGIYAQGNVNIVNCIIRRNHCTGTGNNVGGGGLFARVRVNVTGCLIVGNEAVNGGGMYTTYNNSSSQNINIVNNTFAGNKATGNGGGYMSVVSSTKKTISLVNNIFWKNTAANGERQIAFGDLVHVVSNNAIEGQGSFTDTEKITYTDNITLDAADSVKIFGKNYALLKTSPCVDKGKNATPVSLPSEDVAGGIRMVNDVVDMGAYEYSNVVIAPSRKGIFYVKAPLVEGEETGSGSSWDNHLNSVVLAVASAKTYKEKNPSKHVQIWIAEGTYTIPATLELSNDVSIYGGFAGTERALEERQKKENGQPWEFKHETILDGGGTIQLFNQKEAFATLTYLDGLTFQNAKHTGKGAALYIQSNVMIQYCKFLNNTTTGNGGAINFVGSGSVSKAIYSYFYGNKAGNGGAIFTENSKAEIENCWVEKNSAEKRGGGIYVYQGTVRNSYIYQNHCDGNEASLGGGGGLYGRDGGRFDNCIVIGNTSNRGAGIMAGLNPGYSFVTNVFNCIVADNKATESGAGAGLHASPCKSEYGLKSYNTILWNNNLLSRLKPRMELVQLFNCALQDGVGIEETIDQNCIAIADADKAAAFDGDWKPVEGSPCIDAGTIDGITLEAKDYAGNKRISNRKVDIGAYEYQNPADNFEINYKDETLTYSPAPSKVVECSADKENWQTVTYSSLIRLEESKGYCRLKDEPDHIYALDIPGRGEATGTIDMKEEILKSFAEGAEWNVTGVFTEVGEGKLSDYITAAEKEITIKQPATETAFKTEKILVIPARPVAPAGWDLSYVEEKLIGIEDLNVLEATTGEQYAAMADSSISDFLTTASSVMLKVRYKATDTIFASYPWTIELSARPEAPVYTIHFADSTTVEDVSEYVVYDTVETFVNPLPGVNGKLKLQPGKTYYFKWVASEIGHVFNSATGKLEVPAVTDMAGIRINYATEKLEGLNEHVCWRIEGGNEEKAMEDLTGFISMEKEVRLTVYVPEGVNAFATSVKELVLPKREVAPQWVIQYTDEVIIEPTEQITPDNWEIKVKGTGNYSKLDESGSLSAYIPAIGQADQTLLLRVAAGVDAFHSEECEVVVAARPEKPAFAIDFATEKTTTPVGNTIEYSNYDDMEAAVVGGDTVVLLEPGIDLYFRVKASDTSFASAIQYLPVPERPAINEVVIDFEERSLVDLPRGTVWQINNGTVAGATEDLSSVIPAAGEKEAILKIWVPETGSSFKSDIISLRLPAYPADPQLEIDYEKEFVKGMTAGMMWKFEDTTYVAKSEITDLIPAYGENDRTIQVWVAASDTNFRSLGETTLVLPARQIGLEEYHIDYLAETTQESIPEGVVYASEPDNWKEGQNAAIALQPGVDIRFKRMADHTAHLFASAETLLKVPFRPVITIENMEAELSEGVYTPGMWSSWTNTAEGILLASSDPEIASANGNQLTLHQVGQCQITASLPAVAGERFAAETKEVTLRVVSNGSIGGKEEVSVAKLKIAGRSDMVFRIPELEGMSGVSLTVFNQNGKVIYQAKEYGQDYNMGNLDSGTYYYLLTYTKDGKRHQKKGFVEIVR